MNIDKIFAFLQIITPQHALSRLIGVIGASPWRWIKNPMIRWFVRHYHVDLSEAKLQDPEQFLSFNDFFTRALKEDARPFSHQDTHVMSPADGVISEQGDITHGRLLQAKGKSFSLCQLLAGDVEQTQRFMRGSFSTIYLSPKDYHRVHMPLSGTLTEMVYVPGRLFSVNPATTKNVNSLFARNERVICYFDTEAGPMAVILVGAMIVASIETVWAGEIAPQRNRVQQWQYQKHSTQPIHLNKGDELGRFKMGSTVIVLMGENRVKWTSYHTGNDVRMGATIGDTQHPLLADVMNERSSNIKNDQDIKPDSDDSGSDVVLH